MWESEGTRPEVGQRQEPVPNRLDALRSGPGSYSAKTEADKSFLLDVFLRRGFVISYEDASSIRLLLPKRFGPGEFFAVAVGLCLCLLPGLIWMMQWSRQVPAVVTITLDYNAG